MAVTNEEFAKQVERVRIKLYKTALTYLGSEAMAVDAVDAEKMQRKLLEQGIPAAIVGKITEPAGTEIYVTQSRKW